MFEEELLELLKEFYKTEKFEFTESTKDCISEVLIYKKRYMKRCRSLAWTSRHQKLSFDGENTILQNITYSDDDKTHIFPGKAFDFDLEIIVMKLEG